MRFTYSGYEELVRKLREHGYAFCSYEDYCRDSKCVIMRHDIDYSLEQAVRLAQLENKLEISSTYFVLLSSDFYNPASASSYKQLHQIMDLGHRVGLHFDETAYCYDQFGIDYYIKKEARILGDLTDTAIHTFSLHRPNKRFLETELKIDGLINSYGTEFFSGFKYLSDSRRSWREPVLDIVDSEQYQRLHILTHAFWYHDRDVSMKETILSFINQAEEDRTTVLDDNITMLRGILSEGK